MSLEDAWGFASVGFIVGGTNSTNDIENFLIKNKFKIMSANEDLIGNNEFTSNDGMFIEARRYYIY